MTAARFLVGLLGSGIGASLSPALHEAEGDALDLRLFYQRIDLELLDAAERDPGLLLDNARRVGFRGLNVTHPCKQAVVEHMDQLGDEAAALGAVNTVVFDAGRAYGHNTDVIGFRESFAVELAGAALGDVLQVGAGGAGAAVATALLSLGASRLTILDLDVGNAEALAGRLRDHFPDRIVEGASVTDLPARMATADGLAHATPVGMQGHPGCVIETGWLRPEMWVADIVYRPLWTELLLRARQVGCRTMGGGRMAVLQAAAAFEHFTGTSPDPDRMMERFTQLVAEEQQSSEEGARSVA